MKEPSLNDLEIYREAMEIGEEVREIVGSWNYFAKDSVGKKFVRAADSIAANLSEGHGRFHYKENRNFCFYARGSAEESQTWIGKAARRKLVERDKARSLYDRLETLKKRINAYIKTIGPN